jgi:nitronate monooxygenase
VRQLIPLMISGREVLPLVEGGKGISVSNGESSGAWAASGAVGTFSGVNADSFDASGTADPADLSRPHRRERHNELIATRSPAASTRRASRMSGRTAKAAST